ncbi:hypothetical protein BHAP_0462 [Bifidobacterium hapali]|uniref:Uncharacterized protein n=1 Tax=Bifidobacterium hapali TaxID=1630172 RepID=A0A261G3Z8_9BIFI|nr:hypothetical protein BHAP_0462 [Bifidobacterium hapali]
MLIVQYKHALTAGISTISSYPHFIIDIVDNLVNNTPVMWITRAQQPHSTFPVKH